METTIVDNSIVPCPACERQLAVGGIKASDIVRCCECGMTFPKSLRPAARKKLSRKAIFSLLLACLSVVGGFVTGIAAIFVGLSALKDIRRSGDLSGRPMAVAGIGTGLLLALICTPFWSLVISFLMSWEIANEQPQKVLRIAHRIAQFELPPGVEPQRAMRTFAFTEAHFQDDTGAAHIELQTIPNSAGMTRESLRKQMALPSPWTMDDTNDFSVNSLVVTKQTWRHEETGRWQRRYFTLKETRPGKFGARLTVRGKDPPRQGIHSLTDEQVRAFFESIELVDP